MSFTVKIEPYNIPVTVGLASYRLPNPPSKLKHKRRSVWEVIMTKFVLGFGSSHVCQICRRVEQSKNVSGWLQIDDPLHMDKDGCSVVCAECEKLNPDIFSSNKAIL